MTTVTRIVRSLSAAGNARERAARQALRETEADRDEAEAVAEAQRDDAIEAALEADALLLDEQAQRVAAQVTDEAPFGVPGPPAVPGTPVRTGFGLAFGFVIMLAVVASVLALRQELLLLVIAGFIAIGLEPAVTWLARHGLSRGAAVLAVSVASVALLAAFLAAAVPPIVAETTQLVQRGPSFFSTLQDRHTVIGHLNAQFHIQDRLVAAANDTFSVTSVSGLLSAGQAIVSYAFEVFLVVVLVIYFLVDFDRIKRVFYRMAPLHHRPRVALLGDEILARTGGYILGNLLTSLIAVACQYVVLTILHVPYALVLSVFVGILDLVPMIGSTIAGALVTLIAWAAVSPTAAIVNIGFTIVYRLAEDYVISPRVLNRTVDVRPVVTVVAVLLGSALLGIVGALIAVPTAAAIQLLLTEVVYPRMDSAGQRG